MSLVVPTHPDVDVRGLRRDEYELLVDRGKFDRTPVELLGGVLVAVSPQGSRHAWVVGELRRRFDRALDPTLEVREEKPLAIDELSEPEPDIAVVDPSGHHAHPTSAHLVIEVSTSSLHIDLHEKAARYAAAGVATYWVWDLVARRVVAHSGPGPDGYATRTVHGPTETLTALGVVVALDELLPPAE